MDPDPTLTDWLLDTDPALRWQVERDLLDAPESVWAATRARVATEGFGAALLARQDADGQWAGGAYFPPPDWTPPADLAPPRPEDVDGQPYLATTWSLNSLREWGVEADVLAGTAEKLAATSRWEYDGSPYWGGEVDCCINAYTLANGAWLGADVGGVARWLVEHRLADGGWNCAWVDGSTVSSFHSTINTVRGLAEHEQLVGPDPDLRAARHGGEEYLLQRELLHRRSTGEVVAPWATRLTYPFRWPYSVLKALDHFRTASLLDATAPDPRLATAVELVRAAREPDGRWRQQHRQRGWVWFEVDVEPGEPSPWVTFLALRVLRWWDAS